MTAPSRQPARAPRTVVIVEGASDRLVVGAVAGRMGVDLSDQGVEIVSIGGAHGIGRFFSTLERETPPQKLAGLCDAGEQPVFRRALERVGFGPDLGPDEMERLGFFVCDPDLEGELIRAVGVGRAVKVVEAQGDGQAWRTFQKQPAQRERDPHQQLHRFIRSISGRNVRYLLAFVEALEVPDLPAPLHRLLRHVLDG